MAAAELVVEVIVGAGLLCHLIALGQFKRRLAKLRPDLYTRFGYAWRGWRYAADSSCGNVEGRAFLFHRHYRDLADRELLVAGECAIAAALCAASAGVIGVYLHVIAIID